jgi:hypothetical protein
MTSGYVDRNWAEHHYPLWVREEFGNDGRYASIDPHITPLFDESAESHDNEEADDYELLKTG